MRIEPEGERPDMREAQEKFPDQQVRTKRETSRWLDTSAR